MKPHNPLPLEHNDDFFLSMPMSCKVATLTARARPRGILLAHVMLTRRNRRFLRLLCTNVRIECLLETSAHLHTTLFRFSHPELDNL